MITAKVLKNERVCSLMQEYRKQFKENALMFQMPTGTSKLPNEVTEDELIESLGRCLKENIKLCEIYPSLTSKDHYKKD